MSRNLFNLKLQTKKKNNNTMMKKNNNKENLNQEKTLYRCSRGQLERLQSKDNTCDNCETNIYSFFLVFLLLIFNPVDILCVNVGSM